MPSAITLKLRFPLFGYQLIFHPNWIFGGTCVCNINPDMVFGGGGGGGLVTLKELSGLE